MTWEKYFFVPASIWSQGMTSRPLCGPRCNWMPAPGPVAYHVQLVSFTSAVISRALDQVRPSSLELLTNTRRVSLLVWLMICGFAVIAAVPGVQQPDDPGVRIADHARVAAGVGAVIPDHAQLAPGLAAVLAELEDGVDIPGVAAAVLAPLANGHQVSGAIHDDGRDPEGVIALGAADEGRGLNRARQRPERCIGQWCSLRLGVPGQGQNPLRQGQRECAPGGDSEERFSFHLGEEDKDLLSPTPRQSSL